MWKKKQYQRLSFKEMKKMAKLANEDYEYYEDELALIIYKQTGGFFEDCDLRNKKDLEDVKRELDILDEGWEPGDEEPKSIDYYESDLWSIHYTGYISREEGKLFIVNDKVVDNITDSEIYQELERKREQQKKDEERDSRQSLFI